MRRSFLWERGFIDNYRFFRKTNVRRMRSIYHWEIRKNKQKRGQTGTTKHFCLKKSNFTNKYYTNYQISVNFYFKMEPKSSNSIEKLVTETKQRWKTFQSCIWSCSLINVSLRFSSTKLAQRTPIKFTWYWSLFGPRS